MKEKDEPYTYADEAIKEINEMGKISKSQLTNLTLMYIGAGILWGFVILIPVMVTYWIWMFFKHLFMFVFNVH